MSGRLFSPPEVELERRADGSMLLRARTPLGAHPEHLAAVFRERAARHPERVFLAERRGEATRELSYGETMRLARRLATRMLADGLGPERPVMVLSDNAVDHALVALGAMLAGVPVAPVSAAYSLLSRDHAKLRTLGDLLSPGWIFADDGVAYGRALQALAPAATTRVVTRDAGPVESTSLDALLDSDEDEAALDAAFARLDGDTVAKILFTSGSTGEPKGVLTTHRMSCANQQALAQGWPFLGERPPVVVDWLPWSHTFGGSHNFNLVLWHGGTLWVDRGKPAPGRIEETVATLRRVSPTVYFNVPRGYDALLPFLEQDDDLAAAFFRDLDLLFYAAAALPRPTWDRLTRLAERTRGEAVPFVSAWGSTETAPLVTQVAYPISEPGNLGLPVAGTTLKLLPAGDGGKLEVRVAGPQVTPGYLRDPGRWQAALDEEGFYRIGDAVRLADPADPSRGLVFDGRISEDFKLTSGTWVHVGALRLDLVKALAPLVQDVVVAGHDRDAVGVLLFPNLAECAAAAGLPRDAPAAEVVAEPRLRDLVRARLAAHAESEQRVSSRTPTSAILLAEPPSIDAGEITDKGYLNQRAVLDRRAADVHRLFAPSPEAITLTSPSP